MKKNITTYYFTSFYSKYGISNKQHGSFKPLVRGLYFQRLKRFDNQTSGTFYNDGDAYIYSHFNNEGIVDFYGTTGLTRL
ncbi:hypothetical protein QWY92_03015 [Algibacter miyuki]|uniref:hypothetical protein n=1 Tax=Algibacter miyuki TaxID=1306933 RepID=UPI0025B45247|nr:hypothetical protein [Algibacter miyuki]MDN3664376.1 hypothetical protein [Algibacter miyuki]